MGQSGEGVVEGFELVLCTAGPRYWRIGAALARGGLDGDGLGLVGGIGRSVAAGVFALTAGWSGGGRR